MVRIPTTTHTTTEMVTTIAKEKERGEKRITRNVIFRTFLVVLSLVVFLAFLRPALSEFYSEYYSLDVSTPGENKITLASRLTDEDARYHYLLGLRHYASHDKSEVKRAMDHYLLSLERNPTDGLTWLAIAKAYRDSGDKERAEHAIRKAIYLDKNNPNVLWESGVFLLLQNEASDAIQLFRRYIYLVPEDQENVYLLCYSLGVTPMAMIENLIPEDHSFYKRFLDFLMSNKLSGNSAEAWTRLKKFKPERSEYLQYCDFLIEAGQTREAQALWDEFLKRFDIAGSRPSGEMIWNGDFELPIQNGGFDWKIGSSDGVRIFIDKDIRWTGFASLSVNFNGKTNPGLSIARQLVPVSPGQKYRLSGYIRTEKITTLNGIVIEASNYLCDPFIKKTEPVTGTNLWKKIDFDFTTPKKCMVASIAIKREHSEKFDNKISGDAWIDSLSMIPAKN